MRIAATVDSVSHAVVPLAEGDQVLIYDTESGALEQHENPALTAEMHRRVAAVQFMLHQNADTVIAVPGAFCPHSHMFAVRAGLRFVGFYPGTPFDVVKEQADAVVTNAVPQLPPTWLGGHGMGHQCHHHHHHPDAE